MPEKLRRDARRLLEARAQRLATGARPVRLPRERAAAIDDLERWVYRRTPWLWRWSVQESWWRDVASQAAGGFVVVLSVAGAAAFTAWAVQPGTQTLAESVLLGLTWMSSFLLFQLGAAALVVHHGIRKMRAGRYLKLRYIAFTYVLGFVAAMVASLLFSTLVWLLVHTAVQAQIAS